MNEQTLVMAIFMAAFASLGTGVYLGVIAAAKGIALKAGKPPRAARRAGRRDRGAEAGLNGNFDKIETVAGISHISELCSLSGEAESERIIADREKTKLSYGLLKRRAEARNGNGG